MVGVIQNYDWPGLVLVPTPRARGNASSTRTHGLGRMGVKGEAPMSYEHRRTYVCSSDQKLDYDGSKQAQDRAI